MAWSDTKMRPTTLIGHHAALVPLDGDFHDERTSCCLLYKNKKATLKNVAFYNKYNT